MPSLAPNGRGPSFRHPCLGPPLPLYGLDIETDTSFGGLDPRAARIVAAAVSTAEGTFVTTGDEPTLLADLDAFLARLPRGAVVTWYGSGFDLPYIADRAALAGVRLGLHLAADPAIEVRRPLPGHVGAYRASWGHHTHLDAHQLYKEVSRAVLVSCSLKTMARFFGLEPVEVDRGRIHDLPTTDLRAYVASDAALARRLAALRWHAAPAHLDAAHWPAPARQDAPPRGAPAAPAGRTAAPLDALAPASYFGAPS